jgi:hypothetical protein
MKNWEFEIQQAQDNVTRALSKYSPIERKTYWIKEAIKNLEEAVTYTEDGCEFNVCQWCGEESEDDHPAAICMKG